MTKTYKSGLTAFMAIATAVLGLQISAAGRNTDEVSKWVANAVQWDSVWGSEVTCSSRGPTLSQQLASSKDHMFSIETVRHADGVVAMLPELHRVVSMRLTPGQQLGSLRIETTCEPNLASRDTSLTSLPNSSLAQDPRLQKHREELKNRTAPGPKQASSHTMGRLKIDAPVRMALIPKRSWPRNKIDAFKTIENAVQESFTDACVPESAGVALIPDFELYDPAVLTVIKSKGLTCVLPIGFEHREHSAAPYVAYPTHSCFEDPAWVEKLERLIRQHSAERENLSCDKSRTPG